MWNTRSFSVELTPDVCQRAVRARDPRFDGVFFVAITTTGVYCRPVCPARVTHPERRRFFRTAAAAEHAGFRPCLRCRPELAPGRAICDAVSRLAGLAAHRIAAGALNGRSVAGLADELCVSERHLRRALEREMGVSPLELAQTHRLLLAKRLLADTDLSISRIAYASGFQSLRRFNAVFRERYCMPPNALRRARRSRRSERRSEERDLLRLTLAYRPPFAWDVLLAQLAREAMPGVEVLDGRRFGRTLRLHESTGVVFAGNVERSSGNGTHRANGAGSRTSHLEIAISVSLLPVLMPLLAKLRQFFDLDAEPSVVDAHLEEGGLGEPVRRVPGLRIPGSIDGFDVALRILLGGRAGSPKARRLLQRVAESLGEPIDTGFPALTRLAPAAGRVADAGAERLTALGVASRRAQATVAIARAVADGELRLEPGAESETTRRILQQISGIGTVEATRIVMRALHWPDAFPAGDRGLQRAAQVVSARALLAKAEAWRPWRAYGAMHLWNQAHHGDSPRTRIGSS